MKYCPNCATELRFKNINGRRVPCCVTCGYSNWENPAPVATALLTRNNKIILVRSYSRGNQWSLPSGYVEKGERAEDALVREIKEETNLDAVVTRPLGTYPVDLAKKTILLIAFEASARDGKFLPNNEVSEIREFEPENALRVLRGKEEKVILETWLKARTRKVS